jgi:hypothetical protein
MGTSGINTFSRKATSSSIISSLALACDLLITSRCEHATLREGCCICTMPTRPFAAASRHIRHPRALYNLLPLLDTSELRIHR